MVKVVGKNMRIHAFSCLLVNLGSVKAQINKVLD